MANSVGADKPKRLSSDSIPADQKSVREETGEDSFQYKDVQELWQRVKSAPFLRHLNRNKIRVRMRYPVTYKNEEGADEIKLASAMYGQAPELFVQEKYGTGDSTERQKRLDIGDVMSETYVRDHYGIPRNEHTSPPWSCVHAGLMNCIIVSQDYKNDYEGIRAVQQQIASCMFFPSISDKLFWIGGSGGAPEDYGRKPLKLAMAEMEEKTKRYTLPHNQSLSSPMNKSLLDVSSTQGTVAVFAHPIDSKSPTGRDEANLQFLGHYSGRKTEIGTDMAADEVGGGT